MVAGVQGQRHEQLVAICAGEGNSRGKPGSWNREEPRRGLGREIELFFCIRSSQDRIREIEHFYCILLVTRRPLRHPRGCGGKVERTSIHLSRCTQKGACT